MGYHFSTARASIIPSLGGAALLRVEGLGWLMGGAAVARLRSEEARGGIDAGPGTRAVKGALAEVSDISAESGLVTLSRNGVW